MITVLPEHHYRYFTAPQDFLALWGETLHRLEGERLLRVWGVWDALEGVWFEDAPMLAELSGGTLSVNVSCENKLAVGWNDLLPSDKPVWFAPWRPAEIRALNWTEDLCWRVYTPVEQAFGGILKKIVPLADCYGLRGLEFCLTTGASVRIQNAGDAITGSFSPFES